eukprot:scaffold159_cov346-Pinguiococcus_pyrenoidosus.AAC.2
MEVKLTQAMVPSSIATVFANALPGAGSLLRMSSRTPKPAMLDALMLPNELVVPAPFFCRSLDVRMSRHPSMPLVLVRHPERAVRHPERAAPLPEDMHTGRHKREARRRAMTKEAVRLIACLAVISPDRSDMVITDAKAIQHPFRDLARSCALHCKML